METESQPLIGNPRNKNVEKPRYTAGWFLVVLMVTTVFCLAAVYHQKIGDFLAPLKNQSSSEEKNVEWKQIESISSQHLPTNWQFEEACDDDTIIKLTIAIKQQNVEKLYAELMKVSDPASEDYGKHWTFDEVHDFLKPDDAHVSKVYEWLYSHGLERDATESLTPNDDFIRVTTDVKTANRMLNTQYGIWTHSDSGKTHMRVKDEYYVPSDISDVVDFISPSVRFPVESYMHSMEMISVKDVASISADTTYVTPSTLKDLYSMGSMKGGMSESNVQAVASFLEEWFNDDDLAQFWSYFDIAEANVERVPDFQPSGYGAEAELDVQYITSTGEGVDTVVWDIEDDLYFITLLQQISESAITPSVVSMSYGGDEQAQGEDYCLRANTEFAKVGLLGITFFASSGDSGSVSSSSTSCEDGYSPSFPASSVYVTAVGGTYGGSSASLEADGSGSTGETAWYYSGGGFSVYFDAKSYQKQAVDDFFDTATELPDESRYNRGGAAYPDLSAQSVAYVICYESGYYAVSGTSCSCPAVAGMFALINDMRLVAGKSRLGFINPALYGLYEDQETYFNDVTEGSNEGCSEDDDVAFTAQSGWDPVTGLGTPKFDKLLTYFYDIGNAEVEKKSIFKYIR